MEKGRKKVRKDVFVLLLLFFLLRLGFNGVIKWLETDRNNKNRAWQQERSGG